MNPSCLDVLRGGSGMIQLQVLRHTIESGIAYICSINQNQSYYKEEIVTDTN